MYNNSKCKLCSCKLWQHCIISQAVKLNDRTHIVSEAWWVSRVQTSKMEWKVICWMRQIHKIKLPPPICALSAKMRTCSIFSDIQGHWWVQRVIIHINILHTQRHACPEVQLRQSVIYCTFFLPSFNGCLRVVTRGTSRFNSLHIEETHNARGAQGVRQ